jgi:branched-chain amino acid transport system permease protein
MRDFLELAVSATASGSIYALVALAYLLMIRPTGIINFAVGEWGAIGAFAAFVVMTHLAGLPYPVAILLMLAVCAAVGYATERIAVRPLVERGAPVLSAILVLLGVLVVSREVVSISFGPDPHNVPTPLGFKQMQLGPFAGTPRDFFIIAVAAAAFLGAWWFFERTLWGKAFEAVAINRRAAALMGIDLRRVGVFAFAGGAAVAGLAGVLVSLNRSPDYLMGLPLAIQGFSALVVGGVGRVEGALLGGLILAFAEQITARYAHHLDIPSGLSLGVPYLLMIVFLLLRPEGLIKPREARA